jgi:glycerol uptake facilitator-like aquaporin
MNRSSNHSSNHEDELSFIDDSKEHPHNVNHGLTTDGGPAGLLGGEDCYLTLRTQLCSELVGTYILVLVGSGSACASLCWGIGDGNYNNNMDGTTNGKAYYDSVGTNVNHLPLLWTVGAILGIYSAASVSGGHLNPAVTLAFSLVRPTAFPPRKVLPYWCAQVAGAFLAGLTNLLLFQQAIMMVEWDEQQQCLPSAARNMVNPRCKVESGSSHYSMFGRQLGQCQLHDDLQAPRGLLSAFAGYSWNVTTDGMMGGGGAFGGRPPPVAGECHALFIEAFGTAFVVFVIFLVTSPHYPIPGPAVPPVVAAALGTMLYIVGPLTGHHLNPAGDVGRRAAGTLWLLARHYYYYGPSGVAATGELGQILQTMWIDCRVYLLGPMVGGPLGAWIAEAIQPMY